MGDKKKECVLYLLEKKPETRFRSKEENKEVPRKEYQKQSLSLDHVEPVCSGRRELRESIKHDYYSKLHKSEILAVLLDLEVQKANRHKHVSQNFASCLVFYCKKYVNRCSNEHHKVEVKYRKPGFVL